LARKKFKKPKEYLAREYADSICGLENRKTRQWIIAYYAFVDGYKKGETNCITKGE